MKRIAALLLIVLLLVSAACSAQKGEADKTPTNAPVTDAPATDAAVTDAPAGEFAFTFSTTDLDGTAYTEACFADYDLTVINVWATWCGPCVAELPELGRLLAMLPDNVQFLSICIDGGDDPAYAKQILTDNGCTYPALILDAGLEEMTSDMMYVPTTVFLNSRGERVGELQVGAPKGDDVANAYYDMILARLEDVG